MKQVMAQGTFDIIHPGHLHYLEESASLGDELVVVIARDSRVSSDKELGIDEESRRKVVQALEMVDRAVLGSEKNIFDSVEELRPDIITLGYDQDRDAEELEEELEVQGFGNIEIVRIGKYEGNTDGSSQVRERLKP
ncbi:MAG: adenylyltransferase/cytidyltransferase family protein [Candidatus Nanohaloarchaeota archaeon QJJ-7]|nr:adenylyltransferase/cytidyltransferase family protein [Candidatus Nanohaloarchaeota archaeon QJJ-7]